MLGNQGEYLWSSVSICRIIPLEQIIHKLTISGPVSHLVTRQKLADLPGELLVFGAMFRPARKLGGFHELLFRRKVSSSKQGQPANQRSHSIIHMAVHHLFMQFVSDHP